MWLFTTKPVTLKTFVATFAAVALALFLYHTVIYFLFTSKVLNVTPPKYIGDLARLSYQGEFIDVRMHEVTLPKEHLEGADYRGQPVDILTVGDSFSNGGASGINPYYQDYIASEQGLSVLNIRTLKATGDNVAQTLIALERSGMLDAIHPRAVILGTGSREIVRRFGGTLTWESPLSAEAVRAEMAQMRRHELARYQLQNVPILNTANYKFLYYTLGYLEKPCMGKVCRLELKRKLFSVERGDGLLLYRKTVENIPQITEKSIARVNDNINAIARRLRAKGIDLYFLVAVSKYDLYHDEIAANPFPEDPLFDLLEAQKKEYRLINTKHILKPLVERGEMDVFYADDTHWSYKASEAIVRDTAF